MNGIVNKPIGACTELNWTSEATKIYTKQQKQFKKKLLAAYCQW